MDVLVRTAQDRNVLRQGYRRVGLVSGAPQLIPWCWGKLCVALTHHVACKLLASEHMQRLQCNPEIQKKAHHLPMYHAWLTLLAQRRPGAGGGWVPGLQHAEQWAANSTTAYLQSAPEWGMLLSRAGDALLCYLLVHCSVFVPLGCGNYLQVRG